MIKSKDYFYNIYKFIFSFFAFLGLAYFNKPKSIASVIFLIVSFFSYNIISYLLFKISVRSRKPEFLWLSLLDAFFVTTLVYHTQGLIPQIHLLYFIVCALYCLKLSGFELSLLTISSIVLYSFVTIYFNLDKSLSYTSLILKNLFLLLCLPIFLNIKKQHQAACTNLIKEKNLARIDPLTKLGNRLLLKETLSENNNNYGILLIDLDDFKMINDSFGHDKGDLILKTLSKKLLSSLSKDINAFRIGGEEFLLLIYDCSSNSLEFIAEEVRAAISNTIFSFEGKRFNVTASIGGALSGEGSFDELMSIADSRMYSAKYKGKNKAVVG